MPVQVRVFDDKDIRVLSDALVGKRLEKEMLESLMKGSTDSVSIESARKKLREIRKEIETMEEDELKLPSPLSRSVPFINRLLESGIELKDIQITPVRHGESEAIIVWFVPNDRFKEE